MKKILFIVIAAMAGIACFADNYGFTVLTEGANTQMWAIGISPDGHYVTLSYGTSVLYDTQTGQYVNVDTYNGAEVESEFTAVTNSGTMLGYIDGEPIYAYNPFDETANLTYGNGNGTFAVARGATTDESIIVGNAVVNWNLKAFYYRQGDEEPTLLPYPTEAEIGCEIQGTVALNVSDDGKYICGYAIDWSYHYGALLWVLNDDGEYELEVLCKGIFPSPYYFYAPTAMSHNGKYIAFTLQNNDGAYGSVEYVGRYDVEKREMTATATLANGGECSSTRIDDNGTILVHSNDLDSQSREALIWTVDMDTPQYMRDVYPEVQEFAIYDNEEAWNYASDITPDGRYICGMAFHYFEGEGEEFARRIGWVFDTQEYYTTGIREVSAVRDDVGSAAEYYSVDGKRLSVPQKGLNIVRIGGKTSKVVVK